MRKKQTAMRKTVGAVLVLVMWCAGAVLTYAQVGTNQPLTPESALMEAQRLGIDLTNPAMAMQQAQSLGIPASDVMRLLEALSGQTGSALNASGTPQQSTAPRDTVPRPPAQSGQTGTTALPPTPVILDGVPVITPSTLELTQDRDEVITVLVAFRSEGATSTAAVPPTSSASTLTAPNLSNVEMVLQGPRGMSQIVSQPAQRISVNMGVEVWQGTFFVPSTTASGVWTLAVTAVQSAGRTVIDPAGVVRIENNLSEGLPYFGYNAFQGSSMPMDAGGTAPVTAGYVVGPQDELRLTAWGASEFQYTLVVDEDGRIYVPQVGQFTAGGKRLEDLREDLRGWLAQSYAGLVGEPPTINMDLTLARMRPIQVFVLGEVERPGGYTITNGANIFTALYSVGGPMTRGSLRNVQVTRGGRIAKVDLYDYLLRGYTDEPLMIQAGDYIHVPPRGKTISVSGAVRRPAVYELKEGETLEQLIAFAGGLKADAYTRQFQIDRIIPFEERNDEMIARQVLDFSLADVLAGRESIKLADGDRVSIFSILDRDNPSVRSRVPSASVGGAVLKPGRYELSTSIRTVRDLIERAQGLAGHAYSEKAELIRMREDLKPEIVSLDLAKVFEDVPAHNLVLRPRDSLRVYSITELEEERRVAISGQVRSPGKYALLEGMQLADLLFQAGGLNDPEYRKQVLLERADLFRRSMDGRIAEIIPFDLDEALEGGGLGGQLLRAEDSVRVYPREVTQLVRTNDRYVQITGSVKTPGEYQYFDGMTLEDLIVQAGGFNEEAYLSEAEVTRPLRVRMGEGQRAQELIVPLGGSGELASAGEDIGGQQGLDPAVQAMVAARTFALEHRDFVYIRSNPDFKPQLTVTVDGEVRAPGEYTLLRENETLAEVLNRAGGILPTGYLGGGMLMRDSARVVVDMEEAMRGNKRADVILAAGDIVVVPPRPNTVRVSGNVAVQGLIKYVPGKRVAYYLERAGGILKDTEDIYLVQPTGAMYQVKRGWFRRTPVVGDGAMVQVTAEPPEPFLDSLMGGTDSFLTEVTAILTSTLTLLALIRTL